MTEQGKKNIDLLLPLVLAFGAGYLYFTKYGAKKWQGLLIVIAGVFLASYLATSRITRAIRDAAPGAASLPYDLNTKGCDSYDATAVVKAVYDDSEAWFFRSNDPYEQLTVLSDCQLVKAYNTWNKTYYHQSGGKTLRTIISSQPGAGINRFAQLKSTLESRFAKMSLN